MHKKISLYPEEQRNKLNAFALMNYVFNSYALSLSKVFTERISWQVPC